MTCEECKKLIDMAENAKASAYAPYSNFRVGAALLLQDNVIVCGCNVENASYGLSICAERNAMTTAISQGLKKPIAIAIVGEGNSACPPCGACRQFLSEFNPNMTVVLKDNEHIVTHSLTELLPYSFSMDKKTGEQTEQK